MKKMVFILLAALVLSLAACSNNAAPAGNPTQTQATVSQPSAEELEQQAKAEAEQKAKEEAERLAAEEAERLAAEEAERLAAEEAERLAAEEAERLAREQQLADLTAELESAYGETQWKTVKSVADKLIGSFPDSDAAQTAQGYLAEATAAIEEAGLKALDTMTTQYDKVEQRTWYYPATAPKYVDDRNCFYLYFGRTDAGAIWLRCVANYTGDDWIFFESLTYSVDGQNTIKTLARDDYYRDNAYGNVWEVADYGIGGVNTGIPDYDRQFIESIIESEETIVRFQGDLYHYDHTVTQKEKQGLVDVLAAFDYLLEQGR